MADPGIPGSAGSSSRSLPLAAALMISLAAVGCGAGGTSEQLQPKGKVTLDGKEVVYGTVEFLPDAAKGHEGASTSADIVDGAYDTSAAGGKMLAKGPYIARVTIFPQKFTQSRSEQSGTADAPTPIALGFPVEVNVDRPSLDIAVPASAKGFDMFNVSRTAGSAASAP